MQKTGPDDTAHDTDALRHLNDAYIRSVRLSDAGWFRENLADDFLNRNADGSYSARAEFLERIQAPCPVADFGCEDVHIRLVGDVAVIHGRTVYNKPDGQPGAGRYVDVYARQQGRWLCIYADVTRG